MSASPFRPLAVMAAALLPTALLAWYLLAGWLDRERDLAATSQLSRARGRADRKVTSRR
ncbi:MAG TPA: hypothetical protein VIP07_09695 [Candidatus Limnocylindria bacterium]